MERTILHLDLDAFFCAVEELHSPSLRGKPIAVGGRPEGRGVVSSCSYAARVFGVRSAMPSARAIRLCPELIILKPQHERYSRESKKVMDYLRSITHLVEQLSVDEAFLDVSNLPSPSKSLARNIQMHINESLDLPCSIGVATNKLVAKIANDYGKSQVEDSEPPNAITIVAPGDEAKFLAPLPARALWGVGAKTSQRMSELGINTIGDIADSPQEKLAEIFGKHGIDFVRRAKGIDTRPIVTFHEAKSISQEVTFSQDTSSARTLKRTLFRLSEKVGNRLRAKNKAANTVKIKLRWPDFSTISRQTSFEEPVNNNEQIYSAASELFLAAWDNVTPVRLIGVGVSGLGPPTKQLNLWEFDGNAKYKREKNLKEAVVQIREKFGKNILVHGYSYKKQLEEKS